MVHKVKLRGELTEAAAKKVRRRIHFKPTKCAATSCTNTFTPIREGNLYCSDTCSAYMRYRRKQLRDQQARAQEKLANNPSAAASGHTSDPSSQEEEVGAGAEVETGAQAGVEVAK